MPAHKQKLFEIFIEKTSDENILYVISNGYNDSLLFHRLDLSTPTVSAHLWIAQVDIYSYILAAYHAYLV